VDQVCIITDQMKRNMEKISSDLLFDYYETTLELTDQVVSYYFEITGDNSVCYFNRFGAGMEHQAYYNFIITPGFSTPDWAKGAIFYQIYVDRFCNGDPTNDVENDEYIYIGGRTNKVTDWNKYPEAVGVREFYGGDLQGVLQKLDYLQELGIDVLYLNPIFVSPSNHKYDIQDYDYVDPHFGIIREDGGTGLPNDARTNRQATKYIKRVTDKKNLEASNELFIQLVEEIHRRGMKVILDGVFNHCGSFNKWLDREGIYEETRQYEAGAFSDKNSPYNTFFKFNEDNWPNNTSYDGWWGHDTLPKLNYEGSPKLYEYIMSVAGKWIAPPYNCDGWRLDVAADLGLTEEFNHRFWKDFRKQVKAANPNALIIAEHYGDANSWLKGDQWDTVMNYDAFMEPLTWFLTGLEKHSDEYREHMLGHHEVFFYSMKHYMSRFQTSSLQVAMNELSNHDHSRFLTRTNRMVGRTSSRGPQAAQENINTGIMRIAVMVQMTWPGAPTIYYGDEAGLCGWTDPDNRRAYPWGKEDQGLIKYHQEMIAIHKTYEAFRTGSILFLTGAFGVICFGRFDQSDQFIIAVNNNKEEVTIDINAWEIGIIEDEVVRLIITTEGGFNTEANVYKIQSGVLKLTIPPVSAITLKNGSKI
jgi:alpha-glucosidase